jgi:hypothetical protein
VSEKGGKRERERKRERTSSHDLLPKGPTSIYNHIGDSLIKYKFWRDADIHPSYTDLVSLPLKNLLWNLLLFRPRMKTLPLHSPVESAPHLTPQLWDLIFNHYPLPFPPGDKVSELFLGALLSAVPVAPAFTSQSCPCFK